MKVMGFDYNFVFMHYGKSWRFHRKLCQQNFRAEAVRAYHPLLLKKVCEMLHRLLVDPDNFDHHNKMLSISFPVTLMYGYEAESFQEPCILSAHESISLATKLMLHPGTWINIIPALGYVPPWFPGATESRIAVRIRKLTKDIGNIPLEFAKSVIAQTANNSIVANFLRKKEGISASEEEEEVAQNIAATVYSAASDTTIPGLATFFHQMATNPKIQRKAQSEIDLVIGSGRLPNLDDRPSLPYIEAIYREVLRFRPPVPLNLPHAALEDDYYKGYFIPKGTVVLANIWAMTRNEKLYPDPLQFRPERFFNENGELDNNKRVLAFGFGRRVCVGKYIASDLMWTAIASVLACFDIGKKEDGFGNEIEINDEYDDLGLMLHKSKFQCSFALRSPMLRELLSEAK